MSTATLFLIIAMIFLNSLCWVFPSLSSVSDGYGLSFSLTDNLLSDPEINIKSLQWWQIVGGMVISGIPLFVLSRGIYNLRILFKLYSQRIYFSLESASLLGNVGKSVIVWNILSLLFQPVLSYWLTFCEGEGNRIISVGFDSQDVVTIFTAVCIILISNIFRLAVSLQEENEQFV
ncbi:DUF2975 domain-containing protein [Klebsiella michiganensis]|nr:DUF2975 domain-containing protein [Klebsiella michiganensis]